MTALSRQAFWLAPLLAFVGAVSYFLVFSRFPSFRDFPWVNLPLVMLALGLSIAGIGRFWNPSGWARRLLYAGGFLVSLVIASAFLWYLFVQSYRMPGPTAKTMGLERAPDFALTSARGERVSLGDYRGRGVVLAFYRGFW